MHTIVYEPDPEKKYYSQTGKTVNTRIISGMLLFLQEDSQSGMRKLNHKQEC